MGKIDRKNFISKNGSDVSIRTAEPRDAESLIDINMKIVNENLYMLRSPGEAAYTKDNERNKIENYLNSEGSLYIVAETGNKAVGYLDFQNGPFKKTKHAGSFSLYILNEWRDAGIGKMLLSALIEWAEKNSVIEKVTLNVFSTNERAMLLYQKLGFKEEGRCPKDMKLEDGKYLDSVLMYKFVK